MCCEVVICCNEKVRKLARNPCELRFAPKAVHCRYRGQHRASEGAAPYRAAVATS